MGICASSQHNSTKKHTEHPSDGTNPITYETGSTKIRRRSTSAPSAPAPGSEKPESDEDVKRQAQKQRRRLSVTAEHVGALAQFQNNLKEDSLDNHSDEPDQEIDTCVSHTWRHVCITKKGYIPYDPSKRNQDRYIVCECLKNYNSIKIYGVCDGHGQFGHEVAQFVRDNLPKYLSKQTELLDEPKECITNAVRSLCAALKRTSIDASFSGTTCVFTVIIGDIAYTANIGDSRCVMACRDDDGQLACKDLSIDHKPELPEEKKRILAAGGRVMPLPGPDGDDCGPMRVWLGHVDVPGLAMSRSIGDDVSHEVGVIADPEILTHNLGDSDLFAVWASDGVWEFITSEDMIDIVGKHLEAGDIKKAAKKLVSESVRRWRHEEEVIDDITAVVVQFKTDISD